MDLDKAAELLHGASVHLVRKRVSRVCKTSPRPVELDADNAHVEPGCSSYKSGVAFGSSFQRQCLLLYSGHLPAQSCRIQDN